MELRLSHSRISAFWKCPYNYYLQYVLKVRKKERPTYFAFGTAVHEGIRAFYQGLPIDPEGGTHLVDRVYANEIDMSRMDAQRLNTIEIEKAKVKGIIEGYIKHYGDDPQIYPKILTERDAEIQLPIKASLLEGSGFTRVSFYGLLDCLVQDRNGDWWIKETKTTSDDIEDFLAQARWNAQLCAYMVLAHSILGAWPRGVIFDVIVKSGISQRKSKQRESLSQFQRRCYKLYAEEGGSKKLFVREEIPFNARDIKVWKREVLYGAQDLLAAHRNKRFPMCFESCKAKFGLCDKFPVCSTGKINTQLFSTG